MRPEAPSYFIHHGPKNQTEGPHVPVPGLAFEVAKIRKRGPREEALYLLPDTGFNVSAQIDLLASNIENGVSLKDSFEQIEQDVQGFKVEYLMEEVLFPIVLNRASVRGKERIEASFYGGKLWADAISSQERDGVVKETVVGDSWQNKVGIEEFLLTAEPGSLAVLSSPPGWSGYAGIEYPDTQTYAIEVLADGRVRGFTIKSDIDIGQNEELLTRLGIQVSTFDESLPEKERIKRAINNYVLLTPDQNKMGIRGVINQIRDIKGSDISFVDSKGRRRTFSEADVALENPEYLWTLDDFTQKLISKFKDQVKYELSLGIIDRNNLEIGLGRIILELADKIRGAKNPKTAAFYFNDDRVFDPRTVLEDVQSIPGCAGGGKVNSITQRIGTESKRTLCCTCPFCGKEVEAVIEGGAISCPKCLKSAPWSDELIGEAA